MSGCTYNCKTNFGHVFVTVNFDADHGDPFEVFVSIGKSGSDAQANCEAIGRLISLVLRMNADVSGRERMNIVIAQMRDIGGSRSHRDPTSKRLIRSAPDAVAAALEEIMTARENGSALGASVLPDVTVHLSDAPSAIRPALHGVACDLCPCCGNMTLIRAERCAHCEGCGYSAC